MLTENIVKIKTIDKFSLSLVLICQANNVLGYNLIHMKVSN